MIVEKLINIFAWVCYICGTICIIGIIVTVIFESNIAALITLITLGICILDILVLMGLILWDMTNW